MRSIVLVLLVLSIAVWVSARHANNLLLDMAGDSNGDAVLMLRLATALGADVNAKDQNGVTASQLALRQGNAENLSYLLDHGARISGIDPQGQFALYDAILEDAQPYVTDPGRRAPVVRVLLQHGANANERDRRDVPILVWAAFVGDVDVIAALVERGADVNAASPAGDTPLHIAAEFSNNPSAVSFLVAHGANKAARNNDGKTPIEALGTSTSIKDESTRVAISGALQQ
jgi:uncharacterized protein